MVNGLVEYMEKWLNTTYAYLKESGGGPTYPPKKVTTGPGVLPTGGYSLVEDYPITYDVPPTRYTVPLPFNPGNMGLPAVNPNKDDTSEEIAKENPVPAVLSSNFQRLYGTMMKACIDDQMHGQNNPNAASACQKLAEIGDVSEMILVPYQLEIVGLTPPPQQNAKPDEVQLAENAASLTGQIKTGVQEGLGVWSGFASGLGAPIKKEQNGDPAGNNFQSLNDRLKGFFPNIPDVPNLNSPLIIIGAAVVGVILLVAIVK